MAAGGIPDNPTVAVVMPTTARTTLLAATRAALAMAGVNEVKIVADRNVDQARSALGRAAADERRLEMIGGDGGGLSRARQIGFDRSVSDVVLFLDEDVIPDPQLALGHARHHARRAGQVVLGYMPVAEAGLQGNAVARIYSSDYEKSCAAYDRDPLTDLRMLWGGNVSIRRADGLVVPKASESFLHPQHEDRDFGLRCAAAGLVGVFDRNLVAEHRYVRTPAQLLRASRDQAIAYGTLRAAHPGAPPADYAAGLPRPVASVVRRARPRGAASGLLRSARVSAGACPAWLGPQVQKHVIALRGQWSSAPRSTRRRARSPAGSTARSRLSSTRQRGPKDGFLIRAALQTRLRRAYVLGF